MTGPSVNNYCHIEILTHDVPAAKAFYEKNFGWKMTEFGPEMNNYIMYETPAGITGGFRKPEEGESTGTLTYLAVEDLEKRMADLEASGARVVVPRQEVPGWGAMVVFVAPGGVVQALWQSAAGA